MTIHAWRCNQCGVVRLLTDDQSTRRRHATYPHENMCTLKYLSPSSDNAHCTGILEPLGPEAMRLGKEGA